nr:MAG TPA: hypothetical protein [Caudoviricetes sp.]
MSGILTAQIFIFYFPFSYFLYILYQKLLKKTSSAPSK